MPIKETDKKLEEYTAAIIADAIEDSNKIVFELRDKQEKMIKKADADLTAEALRYQNARIADIKTEESLRINARMIENKYTLLKYREDCANQAFDVVRAKIAAFTESADYLPHLVQMLQKIVGFMGVDAAIELFLRPEDMHFVGQLKAEAPEAKLSFSEGELTLGGMRAICPEKGRSIDMTFDTSVHDMIGHFTELTGLNTGE